MLKWLCTVNQKSYNSVCSLIWYYSGFTGKECWSEAGAIFQGSVCVLCGLAARTWKPNILCGPVENPAHSVLVWVCVPPGSQPGEGAWLESQNSHRLDILPDWRHLPCVEALLLYPWPGLVCSRPHVIHPGLWLQASESEDGDTLLCPDRRHIQAVPARPEGPPRVCSAILHPHHHDDAMAGHHPRTGAGCRGGSVSLDQDVCLWWCNLLHPLRYVHRHQHVCLSCANGPGHHHDTILCWSTWYFSGSIQHPRWVQLADEELPEGGVMS